MAVMGSPLQRARSRGPPGSPLQQLPSTLTPSAQRPRQLGSDSSAGKGVVCGGRVSGQVWGPVGPCDDSRSTSLLSHCRRQ